MKNIKFLLVGIFFGVTITNGQVISWFRIQEMFRFQGFHMFGVFMTAIPVAMIGVQLIKRLKLRALTGNEISVPKKKFDRGYIYGGTIFGIGWALTGACPGPIFAQIGAGITVTIIILLSAIAGTWLYAYLRPKLPH